MTQACKFDNIQPIRNAQQLTRALNIICLRPYFIICLEQEEIDMAIGQRLDIINISKYYGDFKVLDSINIVCEPVEFVNILG